MVLALAMVLGVAAGVFLGRKRFLLALLCGAGCAHLVIAMPERTLMGYGEASFAGRNLATLGSEFAVRGFQTDAYSFDPATGQFDGPGTLRLSDLGPGHVDALMARCAAPCQVAHLTREDRVYLAVQPLTHQYRYLVVLDDAGGQLLVLPDHRTWVWPD